MEQLNNSNRLRINRFIYRVGIITLLLSGTIWGIPGLSSFEPVLLACSLVLICISHRILYMRTIASTIVNKIFYAFIASIAISFVFHPEKTMIVTIVGILLISYTFMIEVAEIKRNNDCTYSEDKNVIMIYLLISQMVSVMRGFTTYRFAGIYSNSNFTGGEAAALCAVSCAIFLQNFYYSDNKKENVIPIISMALSAVIGIATNSRTAVAAIGIMLFLTAVFVLRMMKQKRFMFRVVLLVLFVIVASILLYRVDFVHNAIHEVLLKQSIRQGNVLANRQDRWDIVFDRLKFFGNGEMSSFGTHNTYLSMLDQYGFLAFGLFAAFIVIGCIKSFIVAANNQRLDMKFLPLFCFVCFGFTSLFEQMLLKNIMLLCVYSIPLLSQYYPIRE